MSKLSLQIQTQCTWVEYKFKEKKSPKKIKQVSQKKKQRLEEQWTESQMFKLRYDMLVKQNKNYCVITWKYLKFEDTSPASYAHILPKWMYPEFRYFLNNIALVKWIKEHWLLDSKINELKESMWTKWLIDKISSWEEIIFDVTL